MITDEIITTISCYNQQESALPCVEITGRSLTLQSFADHVIAAFGGDIAALQRNATAAIVNALAYVIKPVHITLSLPCGEQKGHQCGLREALLGNHR